MATETIHPVARHRPWYSILYVQVLIAIALGILLGRYYPDLGKQMKPLGDGFIALIKMMIAPIIFCTVVHGISLDGRSEACRARRPESADLLRGRLDGGAGDRPDRRRSPAARPRLQHRSGHRSTRNPSPPTSPRRRRRASSRICWRSSPTAISVRSRAAICCRCCWSRSSPALPSRFSARPASRSRVRSTRPPKFSLASSASLCASRRSAPSARWRSRSAPTDSVRCGTCSR